VILTGPEIIQQVKNRKILIDPFSENQINPNSYNFRLDRRLVVYTDLVIDPMVSPNTETIEIPDDGLILEPGKLYLGSTVERLGSPYYVPTYAARSSIARLGLFINLSAPLGDIGFWGHWTLQLNAVQPILIYPFIEIGQMMFWVPKGTINLYNGKYQGSKGPNPSLISRDLSERMLAPFQPIEDKVWQRS
jgi:deoxycytidine triphosphate deaminase